MKCKWLINIKCLPCPGSDSSLEWRQLSFLLSYFSLWTRKYESGKTGLLETQVPCLLREAEVPSWYVIHISRRFKKQAFSIPFPWRLPYFPPGHDFGIEVPSLESDWLSVPHSFLVNWHNWWMVKARVLIRAQRTGPLSLLPESTC